MIFDCKEEKMASLTKQLKAIRKNKATNAGKTRKRATAAGTTPRFPIHVETAPDAVLAQPPGSDPKEKA